jgi:hypothetical protein
LERRRTGGILERVEQTRMIRIRCKCHGFVSFPESETSAAQLDYWIEMFTESSHGCVPIVDDFILAPEVREEK